METTNKRHYQFGEYPFRAGAIRIDMQHAKAKKPHRAKLPTKMNDIISGKECVFTFGSSDNGLAGNGGTKFLWTDIAVPTLNKHLSACNVIDVNCGKKTNIIITHDKTYCWGSCVYGNCVPGSAGTAQSRPFPIKDTEFPEKNMQIVHSATSFFTTVALTSDGDVLKWGSLEFMKMNQDPTVDKHKLYISDTIEKIPSLCRRRIVQLAAGASHFMALNAGGTVYSWGEGNYGKLGHDDEIRLEKPKVIKELKWLKIYATWVSCGDDHSVIIGYMINNDNNTTYKEKVVLTFGKWDDRLGLGDDYPKTKIQPVLPRKPSRRSFLRYSYQQLFEMAKELRIEPKQAYDVLLEHIMEHLWEEHRVKVEKLVREAKRLSLPRMKYPKLVPTLRKSNIIKADCGASFTLLLDDDGNVCSFGKNAHSQLGLGDTKPRSTPTKIKALQNISFCAAGARHAAAVNKFGELWMWGDSHYGQCGFGDYINR